MPKSKHLNDQAKMEKTLSHVAPFCKKNFGKASSGSLKSAKCWLIAGRFKVTHSTDCVRYMTVWHTIDPQSKARTLSTLNSFLKASKCSCMSLLLLNSSSCNLRISMPSFTLRRAAIISRGKNIATSTCFSSPVLGQKAGTLAIYGFGHKASLHGFPQ